MELDHDTGAMRGTHSAGPARGCKTRHSRPADADGFSPEIDEESRALLMRIWTADRPAGVNTAQDDPAAGPGRAWSGGKMTDEEAYQILGLQRGRRRTISAGRTAR